MVTLMLLWAGLGNPGEKYKNQRHNIGFMIVDRIAIEYSFSPWRNKMNAYICEGEIEGHKILLAKPQSFMNKSDTSLGQIVQFFKILDSSVYVFHDDIDLRPGQVRVKNGGGHGGHNGLRDIDAYIGKNYWRIRMGIGRPNDKALVNKWVLSDFSANEQTEWLDSVLQSIAKEANQLTKSNPEHFNSKILWGKPVKSKTQIEHTESGEENGV